MANETKPKLFSYYDDEYDYNTFSRAANTGFADYISLYDYNDLDRQYIWDAYSNLLSGIGDGSIIFNNGRLRDLKGRYSNNYYYDSEGKKLKSKGDNRDYYGVAANYLLGVMGNLKKYEAPTEEKPVWDDVTRLSDLSLLIFRTSNPTDALLKYFIDNDALTNGTRGTSERARIVADALSKYYTEENLLSKGASEEDAIKYSLWAKEAVERLNDGKIDPGDTHALSRLLPGYDLDALFRSELKSKELIERELSEFRLRELNTLVKLFEDYWNNNFSSPSGASRDFTLNKINLSNEISNTYLAYDKLLNSVDTDTLYKVLLVAFNNPTYDFSTYPLFELVNLSGVKIPTDYIMSLVLSKLEDKGLITEEGELTGLLDNNFKASYVWDKLSHKLKRIPLNESKYWREKIFTNFTGKKPKQDNTWINELFVLFQKKGGVLKAEDGASLWYSSLLALGDYDPANYTYSYNTLNLVGLDSNSNYINKFISDISRPGNRYSPTTGNTRTNTQAVENLLYYKNFGNALLNSDGTLTDIGLKWAKATDALLPENSLARFFNPDGTLRTSWTTTVNDAYGRGPKTFNSLADYINHVRYDLILGSRHNVFSAEGKRYFYEDSNGNKHYVDPNNISDYEVSKNYVNLELKNGVLWNDYELTGLKRKKVDPGPIKLPSVELPLIKIRNPYRRTSYVNPTEGKLRENTLLNWVDMLGNLSTDLLGIGRLFGSLRTNNRVHDTLMDSLNPVLKDTYELYSPITGAFSEMQFRNRQAADLRRLVARPFTSDASLLLAGLLEANRQARDLEYQGFLADDKEIKRTLEAALARLEDNIKRRSDVANFNRASINQTNRERAELDAARLRNNWQSVDNYLSGVESRLRSRLLLREDREYQTGQMLALNDYLTAILEYNKKYKRDNPGATTESMLADPVYVRHVQDLKRRYLYNLYELLSNRTYRPNFNTPPSYLSIIYSKLGGLLLPKTVNLINKVIRNENNT